jgi:light-regulated signal transduction histidine kinase (bacteriophytochrome)
MSVDFRTLFELVPGRYVVLSPGYLILAATDAYLAAAMQPRESIIGRALFDVFPDNPGNPAADGVRNLRTSLDRVRATKRFETMPIQRYDVRGPGGEFEEKYWRPSNTPVLDEEGELTAIIHAVDDVTDLAHEHHLLHESNTALAATNEELEAFCYSVAHDLRAPLRGIQGFSQALLEDYAAAVDGKGQNYLQRVAAAALRMSELIDDLLNLSRISRAPLSRTEVDLSALAREIVADLQQHHTHRVQWTIADGLHAHADARLLKIVLENLLGNAFKFTARSSAARAQFGRTEVDGATAFFVRDNGAGFDQAYAAKLFAPFQRLHAEKEFPGTGIGLATVQRVVRRHGGRAWANGTVDGGATFYFTLPE